MEQQLTTSPQQHWLSKFVGLDSKIEYKVGKLNNVANALSRRDEEEPYVVSNTSIPLF